MCKPGYCTPDDYLRQLIAMACNAPNENKRKPVISLIRLEFGPNIASRVRREIRRGVW